MGRALLHDLLAKGYLPRELPPPFVSETWADLAVHRWPLLPTGWANNASAHICKHTIPRQGCARRELGIPNPLTHLLLCSEIAVGRATLAAHLNAPPRPLFSASRPIHWRTALRAVVPRYRFSERIKLRLRTRRSARYLLHVDISQFYGSLYTHALPWALHTKATAKANQRNAALLGNRLDRAIRNGQDRQTIGVPIGPDTSLIAAEILLRAVDDEIRRRIPSFIGFRYIDDYELAFANLSEAEEALGVIESAFRSYELKINPQKTSIEETPATIEAPWIYLLRQAMEPIARGNLRVESRDVQRLASIALECAAQHPDDSVLKFAVAMLSSATPASPDAAQYLQAFAFNAMSSSATATSRALGLLAELEVAGYSVRRPVLAEVLNGQLGRYVRAGRENEVAWILWGAIIFNVPLGPLPPGLDQIEDDVVALLALHWCVSQPLAGPPAGVGDLDDTG